MHAPNFNNHATLFIRLIFLLYHRNDLNEHILYYISSSLRRLLAVFSVKQLLTLDSELVGHFVNKVSEGTVVCCQELSLENEVSS